MSPATVTLLLNDVVSLKAEQRKLADRMSELSRMLGKTVGDHQITMLAMFGEIIKRLDGLECQHQKVKRKRYKRCA